MTDLHDGLMLGGAYIERGRLVTRKRRSTLWTAKVCEAAETVDVQALARRWDGQIPADCALSAVSLAAAYLGAGSIKGKYSVRLALGRFAQVSVERFAERLRAKYGWVPRLFLRPGRHCLWLARPGDRAAFAALVAPHLPAGTCVPAPPSRRLSARDREVIRTSQRTQVELARAYGVSQAHISRVRSRRTGEASVSERWHGPRDT